MTQETRRRMAAVRRWMDVRPGDRRVAAASVRTPRFSRGIERPGVTAENLHVGRFSEGIEQRPDDPLGEDHIGRFSRGIETRPGDGHVGRFSEGVERLPDDGPVAA